MSRHDRYIETCPRCKKDFGATTKRVLVSVMMTHERQCSADALLESVRAHQAARLEAAPDQ